MPEDQLQAWQQQWADDPDWQAISLVPRTAI
jgi:hypothetical protein